MRRIPALLTVGLVALGATAAAAPAAPPGGGATFTLPDNRCGFPVVGTEVADNEKSTTTTLTDGTEITHTTGLLIMSFAANGKTITRNVSGPTTATTRPDGTGTFEATGPNWFTFGPVSQQNTRQPGLIVTKGPAVIESDGIFATSFSLLTGQEENVCATLASP